MDGQVLYDNLVSLPDNSSKETLPKVHVPSKKTVSMFLAHVMYGRCTQNSLSAYSSSGRLVLRVKILRSVDKPNFVGENVANFISFFSWQILSFVLSMLLVPGTLIIIKLLLLMNLLCKRKTKLNIIYSEGDLSSSNIKWFSNIAKNEYLPSFYMMLYFRLTCQTIHACLTLAS